MDNKINRNIDSEGKIGQFFKKNKSLVFVLPILFVLIIVLILVYSNQGTNNTKGTKDTGSALTDLSNNEASNSNGSADSTNSNTEDKKADVKVEVLPQKVRTTDQMNYEEYTPSQKDPFEQPMVLSGVLLGDNEEKLAIIESGGKSFVAKEGDTVGKYWNVEKIKEDGAVLSRGGGDSVVRVTLEQNEQEKSIIKNTMNTGNISINVENADLRDVLSAIALGMNTNIILVEQPTRVSFQIKNVSYNTALDYLLRSNGMEYLANGNLTVVGKRETLQKDFFNQMLLTRYDLNFITSEILSRQIDTLGIPIKKITIDENQKSIWVQGTPQSLSKVKELIAMIDIEENSNEEGIHAENIKLVPFELKYITADSFDQFIKQIGINAKTIIIDTNPQKIWVKAKEQELVDIGELAKNVDIEENRTLLVSSKPLELIPYSLEFIHAEELNKLITQIGIDVKALSFPSSPYKIWIDSRSNGITDFEELITKVDKMENGKLPLNITTQKLQYLTADKFKAIIQQLGIPIQVITLGSNTYTVWLSGDERDLLDIKFLLRDIDTKIAQEDSTYFLYELSNISPTDAVSRFQLLNIEYANVYSLNYPLFSKELLIICPTDRKTEITDILKKIDIKGEKIKVPVDYSNNPAGQARLAAREVLVKLTGIPATSFFISNNISRDETPYFVMWVEETPENIRKIRDMVDSIDNP